ncbi:MAG: DUF1232 domain-containing protein [Paludibacteraceae bacterium]|jgi:uncharacterized membrane protein YkvA (DUF1232 family)|nr:DUF1232 domain-containing protein [Paludibacteraceae bacterium]
MLMICILIYLGLILSNPIASLVEKLKDVNWKEKFAEMWDFIKEYARKAGRMAAKPLLQFYYVVTDGETTTAEKAMIYACIAYVVLPFSLLPRAAYKLLGIMDEAAAVLFVYTKIKDKITPAIEIEVENTLDAWFGAEYSIVK